MKKKAEKAGNTLADLEARVTKLERQRDEDIDRFKRILSINPLSYIDTLNARNTKLSGLAITRAFKEVQKVAFKRLVDLDIIDERTGKVKV